MKMQVGVIGLAVMGKNLALNIESRGYSVAVYNRSKAKTDALVIDAKGKNLKGTYSLEEFAASLSSPRIIILMVQAGEAVDKTIDSLLPYLDKGDIIIDGGNSFFMDTRRRSQELEEKGFRFMGCGDVYKRQPHRLGKPKHRPVSPLAPGPLNSLHPPAINLHFCTAFV